MTSETQFTPKVEQYLIKLRYVSQGIKAVIEQYRGNPKVIAEIDSMVKKLMMTEAEIEEWVMLADHICLTHKPISTLLYLALSVKKGVKPPVWEYLSTTQWAGVQFKRENYEKWNKNNIDFL